MDLNSFRFVDMRSMEGLTYVSRRGLVDGKLSIESRDIGVTREETRDVVNLEELLGFITADLPEAVTRIAIVVNDNVIVDDHNLVTAKKGEYCPLNGISLSTKVSEKLPQEILPLVFAGSEISKRNIFEIPDEVVEAFKEKK